MKYFNYISILLVLITGCVGTRTIYKAEKKIHGNKLGITYLNKQHPAIDTLFPSINSLYDKEIEDVLIRNGYLVSLIKDSLDFKNPSIERIREICRTNNLDGLFISYINFTHVKNYFDFIPISEYFDNTFETKLFDKEGSLIVSVKHDTKYDIYQSVPETDLIITTSIKRSVEQLLKELNNE